MSILLKQALVYDGSSEHHLQKVDILIHDGLIERISDTINPSQDCRVISGDHLCVSPGWLDVGAFNGEPGYESLETLHSLKSAAAVGGFTYMAPLPNTTPAVDNKAQIKFLQNSNTSAVTETIPIGCATQGSKGKIVAEMIDMNQAGAIAFTDGPNNSIDRGQLVRILEYLKRIDGTYIHYLKHNTLATNGVMNEGAKSISMGVAGLPKVEELLESNAAIELASYVDHPINIHNISCPEIAQRHQSSQIKYSVPFMNLICSDDNLEGFKTAYKVLPPLRTKQDLSDLLQLINQGVIQCINSNHRPVLEENKDREFGMADFGAIGLSKCFAALNTLAPALSLEKVISCLSQGSYNYLNVRVPHINIGQKAVLTIFDPNQDCSITTTPSICNNDPFSQIKLKGQVKGVINGIKSNFF